MDIYGALYALYYHITYLPPLSHIPQGVQQGRRGGVEGDRKTMVLQMSDESWPSDTASDPDDDEASKTR